MVLFLGRITFQKGPDYFVEAAAQVLQVLPDVTFVMAGAGDMMGRMIERVGELGIGDRFHFTGFLQGEEIERIFSLSDLYVMPSVSEPFGISPLEAMMYDVPVIISRQSGVSEILKHALKVDFWDVREIAAKIIAVLKYPVLAGEMAEKAREELRKIRWETAAERIAAIYRQATASGEPPSRVDEQKDSGKRNRCRASVSIFRSISPAVCGDTPSSTWAISMTTRTMRRTAGSWTASRRNAISPPTRFCFS